MEWLWPTIPDGIAPWWYFTAVGLGVLVVGVSKGGFGGGTGILAVPLLAAVMPPAHMLGLLLPVLIAADILSNAHYMKQWHFESLKPLLLGAVVGVGMGTLILLVVMKGQSDEMTSRILAGVIGGLCLIFVGMQAYRLTGRELPTIEPGPKAGVGVGFFAATVSTIAHAAGPIITLYMLQFKLDKKVLVGTMLVYFLLINSLKVPPLVFLGIINKETLLDSVWFIPILPVGTLLGAWLHNRIPEKPFMAIMYIAAAISAAHLLYKAAM